MAITKAQLYGHMAILVRKEMSPGHMQDELVEYIYAFITANGASVPDGNLAAALTARNTQRGNQ